MKFLIPLVIFILTAILPGQDIWSQPTCVIGQQALVLVEDPDRPNTSVEVTIQGPTGVTTQWVELDGEGKGSFEYLTNVAWLVTFSFMNLSDQTQFL